MKATLPLTVTDAHETRPERQLSLDTTNPRDPLAEQHTDRQPSLELSAMPGEQKYDFLRRESSSKTNSKPSKGFSEQMNNYWKTPEPAESKPHPPEYKPTPDLLNFYTKKPVPFSISTYSGEALDTRGNTPVRDLQDKNKAEEDVSMALIVLFFHQ